MKKRYGWFLLFVIAAVLAGFLIYRHTAGQRVNTLSLYERWKINYQTELDDKSLKVIDPYQDSATVSEGMAYGMLFAVFEDDRKSFDGLWKFVQEHQNQNGLMNWKIASDGTVTGEGAATDAEQDIAYSLYLASERWGETSYLTQAVRRIDLIQKFLLRSDGTLLPGDNWGDTVAFNPSYVSPEYYLVFYELTGDTVWLDVLKANMTKLKQVSDQNTGLVPNWVDFETDKCSRFGYESVRVPIRLYQFLKNQNRHTVKGTEESYQMAAEIMNKMSTFAKKKGVEGFEAEYQTDGSDPQKYQNNTFLSAGLAMLLGNGYNDKKWITTLWNRKDQDYFGDSMRLWCFSLQQDRDLK